MPFTKPQVYIFLKYAALSVVLGLCIATYNIFNSAYKEVQRERLAGKLETVNIVAYRDTVNGVDWHTYTNGVYGYEISYPEGMKLSRSSEIKNSIQQTEAALRDAIVFIKDPEEQYTYTISAGTFSDQSAKSFEELKEFVSGTLVPYALQNSKVEGLEVADFNFYEAEYDGHPAITITSPIGFRIVTFSDTGKIMTVSGNRYDGSLETEKDRNTRQIMETFRLLD